MHVDRILQHPELKDKKTIRLNTDLLITYRCEESVAYKASNEDNGQWVGSYLMQYRDTIWNIQLRDMLYNCSAGLQPANAQLMNSLNGSWQYNKELQILSIQLYTEWNEALGIALSKPRSFDFRVETVNGQLRFRSDTYTLTRL